MINEVPDKLYVTPYYKNKYEYEASVHKLRTDAHKAYDAAFHRDVDTAANILLAWSLRCSEAVNFEAKLHLVWMGHLFLEASLLMPEDEWNSGVFAPWVDLVYREAVQSVYWDDDNKGSWGILGAILTDLVTKGAYFSHIDRLLRHMSQSWEDDGTLVHEVKRTNSGIWYSYFSLAPMFRACDLLSYEGVGPEMLLAPLNFLWTYTRFPNKWPYRLPRGFMGWFWKLLYPCSDKLEMPNPKDWPANLLLEAGKKLGIQKWIDYADLPLNDGIHIFREYSYS